MKTVNSYISRSYTKLTKIVLISILTTTAIVSGVVPEISWQTAQVNFSNKVLAQSDEELQRYARALSEIEKLRQTTWSQIESMVGSDKASQVACNQPSSISSLDNDARNLANDYCKKSEAIVKKHGFTNAKFNEITKSVQTNPTLQKKVQGFMQ